MRSLWFSAFCFWLSISLYSQEVVGLAHSINKVDIYGYTRAYRNLTISSEIAGKCLKTSGEIGSIVKENETVFVFDDTNIKLQIEQCKTSIDIAARQISFFDKEVDRTEKLLKTGGEREIVYNDFVLKRDLAVMEKKLKENQLEQLKDQLAKFQIIGPVGFTLERRLLEAGALAAPGVPLAIYGDYQRLIIPISLTFEEFQVLDTQKEFEITLVDYQKKAKAKLLRRYSNFDEMSRKILVDLELLDYPVNKVGGIKVLLTLELPSSNSFIVPEKAVSERYEEYFITTETDEKIKVKILSSHNDYIEIQGKDLKEGMKIKIKK